MADFEWLAPGGHQRLVNNVKTLVADKPDATGTAPDLLAGAALGITGDGPTESAAWLQRTSTSDGPTTVKGIHGRTLRWNQLVTVPFIDGETQRGITFTANSDGTVSLSGTSTQTIYKNLGIKSVAGHTYLVRKGGTLATDATLALYNDSGGITVNSQGSAIATANAEKNFFFRVAGNATVDGTVLPQIFDLTAMFGAGNEPSTVAEFEALYPASYYPYDAGSLLPVNMTGIESTGFNQFDEQWQVGGIAWATGAETTSASARRSDFIPVFPDTAYHFYSSGTTFGLVWYDANKAKTGSTSTSVTDATKTSPSDARYVRIAAPMAIEQDHVCINLSWSGYRDGEYEPYWSAQRLIDVAAYFPDGMRSAGSVYDELTETAAITRIGERAYQSGDESDDTVVTDGTVTHYVLSTPTTVEIDPPLNLTYRTEQGGIERVMVPTGETSAPPTIVTAQGYTAESLRDAALSAIAPVENGLASTNYAVGAYLVHGGQLCKVTTAIATGEAISIGTNVVTTTVMAEVIALIAQ